MDWQPRDQRFGIFPDDWRRRVVVLDTCRVIDDLKDYIHGGTSPIDRSTVAHSFGGTLYFAPSHVFDEMYRPDNLGNANKFEKLSGQANDEGWPTAPEAFREVFEAQFLQKVRFVDPGDLYLDHPFAQSIEHDADVPTGQLAALLCGLGPLIFSSDKHLRGPGLAPRDLPAVLAASVVVESTDGMTIGASYLTLGVGAGLNAVVKRSAKLLDVQPIWLWLALGGLMLWAFDDDDRRTRWREAVGPVWSAAGDHVVEGVMAKAVIDSHAIEVPAEPDDLQRLAAILGRASRPMTYSEIEDRWPEQLDTTAIPALLNQHPCFVATPDGWQLGETVEPATL